MPVPTELKNPPPKMDKPPIHEVEQIQVKVSHNFEIDPFKIFISLNLALQIKRNISEINSGYQGGHQDYLLYWLQTTRRNEFIFRM